MMIVVAPTVGDEGLPTVVERVSGYVAANGGSIETYTHENPWGRRRLAYPIQKFQDAFYVLYYFESAPTAINEIERDLRLDEQIIRHLIIKYDAMAEHSSNPSPYARMHEPVEEEEEVAEAVAAVDAIEELEEAVVEAVAEAEEEVAVAEAVEEAEEIVAEAEAVEEAEEIVAEAEAVEEAEEIVAEAEAVEEAEEIVAEAEAAEEAEEAAKEDRA